MCRLISHTSGWFWLEVLYCFGGKQREGVGWGYLMSCALEEGLGLLFSLSTFFRDDRYSNVKVLFRAGRDKRNRLARLPECFTWRFL